MNNARHCSQRFHICETEKVLHAGSLAADLDESLAGCGSICLYVLTRKQQIVYVGSSKNIGKTLKSGNQRRYPYKWLKAHRGSELHGHFFAFPDDLADTKPGVLREGIEGEVVFEIRRRTGKWPSCQIEIHFQEALRPVKAVRDAVSFVIERLERANVLPKARRENLVKS